MCIGIVFNIALGGGKGMRHTATGCSAFDNPLEYRPTKKDGTPKEYCRSAYRRPKWNDAFPCILRESDGMGGMITCHPGRLQEDGTYSDARAYTVLELLRGYDLPHDFPFPAWTLSNFSVNEKRSFQLLGKREKKLKLSTQNAKDIFKPRT